MGTVGGRGHLQLGKSLYPSTRTRAGYNDDKPPHRTRGFTSPCERIAESRAYGAKVWAKAACTYEIFLFSIETMYKAQKTGSLRSMTIVNRSIASL